MEGNWNRATLVEGGGRAATACLNHDSDGETGDGPQFGWGVSALGLCSCGGDCVTDGTPRVCAGDTGVNADDP